MCNINAINSNIFEKEKVYHKLRIEMNKLTTKMCWTRIQTIVSGTVISPVTAAMFDEKLANSSDNALLPLHEGRAVLSPYSHVCSKIWASLKFPTSERQTSSGSCTEQ